MAFPYIIQGDNIVVVIGNKSHTVSKMHIAYSEVLTAIKAQDWEAVKSAIEPKKVVLNFGAHHLKYDEDSDELTWDNGEVVHHGIATRIVQMIREGFSIDPLVAFMKNLEANPSKRAVEELYGFLERSHLPITPDGHFLAYKKVRADYTDCHTGVFDNSVGAEVTMPRNKVDDNKENTCSAGLHFCSLEYLKSFGGARTVIVKINPADVVSIPVDYNNAKGRACRYVVIGELADVDSPADAFTESVQSNGKTIVPNEHSAMSDYAQNATVAAPEVIEPTVVTVNVSSVGTMAKPLASNAPGFLMGYRDGLNGHDGHATARPRDADYEAGYTEGANIRNASVQVKAAQARSETLSRDDMSFSTLGILDARAGKIDAALGRNPQYCDGWNMGMASLKQA